MEAGQLAIERGVVDLQTLAEEAVEAARPAAEAKGIEIRLETDGVPPIAGDAARLAQLLDNLLSNAVKFTPAGGRVDVTTAREGELALLDVADNGAGIPADEQERLFERFFRSPSANENAVQGTGLGLSIAKAIAEAHGGRIRVESVKGVGTTFRVELPT